MCDREQRHQFSNPPGKDEQGHPSPPPPGSESLPDHQEEERPRGQLDPALPKDPGLQATEKQNRAQPGRPETFPVPTSYWGPNPPRREALTRLSDNTSWREAGLRCPRWLPQTVCSRRRHMRPLCPESTPLCASLRGAGPSLISKHLCVGLAGPRSIRRQRCATLTAQGR